MKYRALLVGGLALLVPALALGQATHSIGTANTTLGILKLFGSTSGDLSIKPPAVAGTASTVILPAGSTDFSATGGTSQFVKQASAGAALTVARPACADLSDAGAGCTGSGGGTVNYCEAWITATSTITGSGSCGTAVTNTWTVPSWVTANTIIVADVLGAGGGGAFCNTASAQANGGGAGGLARITGTNLVTASVGYTFAIGAAGTAGTSGAAAGNGGNSTLAIGAGPTTYTGSGGIGAAACTTSGKAPSAAGTGTNGTINLTGEVGWGTPQSPFLSKGGNPPMGYGFGAMTQQAATAGVTGTGFGSGGSSSTTTSNANGGAGTAGVIHIILSGQ